MLTQFYTHPIRAHLAVYGFFLAVAVLITWPLVTVLSSHFAGYPFGDAHEMTRHIWWFRYALEHGQPLIFQPLLGYPDGMQGVILWSDPLQFFPAWLFALVMPLPAAYNLHCLLNLALNGWAAYYLVWKLTDGERFPALVAGVVFMAAPTMQGHLAGGHGGLLVQWPLPLLAWGLTRLRGGARPPREEIRNLFLATLWFVLLPLGHTLQLIYAGLPLVGVFGALLLARREWWALARLTAVVIIGSAILVVFLIPVFQETVNTDAYTGEGGAVTFSIDLLGVVTPSFNHPLYGQLEYTRRVLGVNLVEGSSYVGIAAGLLALVAAWKARAARPWLLLGMTAWVLAMGPLLKVFDTPLRLHTTEFSTYVTLPWALVADWPGLNLARTPGRFNFVLALVVAVLAGYGAAWLSAQFRVPSSQLAGSHRFAELPAQIRTMVTRYPLIIRYSLLVTVVTLILFDYQSYWPLPTYSAAIPGAIYDLAGRTDVRAVFDLPWDNVLAAKDALWLQTAHEKPLIAGQVTRRTPVSPAKLAFLAGTLDPALLKTAGADVVILHKWYIPDPNASRAVGLYLGQPFYEDDQLALYNVPEHTEQPIPTVVDESGGDAIARYFYTAEPGWVRLDNLGRGLVSEGRPLVLTVDGEPLRRWLPSADADLDLWLPIAQAGFHAIVIQPEPPCPRSFDDSQRCPTFGYAQHEMGFITLSDPIPAEHDAVVFERGVTLKGRYVSAEDDLSLGLWWQFDQPVTDQMIRFVKVLDESGNQVAGSDETLGNHATGEQWADTVRLPLTDAPPGDYRVCAGWYTYPDLTRFAVRTAVDGAPDGLACIGTFTIPASSE